VLRIGRDQFQVAEPDRSAILIVGPIDPLSDCATFRADPFEVQPVRGSRTPLCDFNLDFDVQPNGVGVVREAPVQNGRFPLQEDSDIAKWPPPAGYKFCVRGSAATADRMPLVANRSEQLIWLELCDRARRPRRGRQSRSLAGKQPASTMQSVVAYVLPL
jgi:hypothetical protein